MKSLTWLVVAGWSLSAAATQLTYADDLARERPSRSFGDTGVRFEPNRGQIEWPARFLSRGKDYRLFLSATDAVFMLSPTPAAPVNAFILRWLGADPDVRVDGGLELPGRVHYLNGRNPSDWIRNVPTYGTVIYDELYPGISLQFHGTEGPLEYDFLVDPGIDPSVIRLTIAPFPNAPSPSLEIAADGTLRICLGESEVRWAAPFVYQQGSQGIDRVEGSFRLFADNEFGFQIGPYDAERTLIIDPFLVYGSYLGASGVDSIEDVAIDDDGNAYVTGLTTSSRFPLVNPILERQSDRDAFVSKFSPTGEDLIYSTYLGGSRADSANAIAVDDTGAVYVAGSTRSVDFPIENAFQDERESEQDAFLLKIDPAGASFVFSTYMGGNRNDNARAVAVDDVGNVYVAGSTNSNNFPLENPIQDERTADQDVFVAKFDPTATTLIYSTYLGGGRDDAPNEIAADDDGNTYVVGTTRSGNFPTANALQDSHRGSADCFVVKIDPTGSTLVFSTYLGAGKEDTGEGLALDAANNIYITGTTESGGFPRVNAMQSQRAGGPDAFVAILNAAGDTLTYSSYLGGGSGDTAADIALGPAGRIYIAGTTSSNNFPLVDALIRQRRGNRDAFLSVLEPAGGEFFYSTYVGGDGVESATSLVVDSDGNAYIAGETRSKNLPVRRAFQDELRREDDGFLLKFSPEIAFGFSVTRIKSPRRIKLKAKKPSRTKKIKVRIENRGGIDEVIPDLDALEALVTLDVESLGACPDVVPVLIPPKRFPITVRSRRSLNVVFEATFDCANDPLKSKGGEDHDDFRCLATVDRTALGVEPDDVPEDDDCPRDPVPDLVDPLGKVKEIGCGEKRGNGTRGAPVVIDVVEK